MPNLELENILHDKGVKPTSNRILVMRELMKASHPVSLADLECSLGFSLDRASIFRVLELFAEKDVVHVLEDGSRSLKYELCHTRGAHQSVGDLQSIGDLHPHFYCERCRQTFCFDDMNIPPIQIPEGFLPRSVNYMVKGLCPHCAESSSQE